MLSKTRFYLSYIFGYKNSLFMMSEKIFNGSADRNKAPILETLKDVFKDEVNDGKTVLEISSGTGQHVTHFAQYFTQWEWQPSEFDESKISSIKSYIEEEKLSNIKQPVFIDASTDSSTWNDGKFQKDSIDLMININMIHISPLKCTEGLLNAASNLLKSDGKLITYGPYAIDGVLSPESNVNFDLSLKSRNPEWSVRDVSLLRKFCLENSLTLERMVDMPSNNKCLIFVKKN